MTYEHVRRMLDQGRVVVLDGATGTELQRRGAPMANGAWSSLANLDYLDVVRELHREYVRAGADVIITNTFSASRERLARAGIGDRVTDLNRTAVKLAQEAVATAGRPVAIAGSVSTVPQSEAHHHWETSTGRARLAYREQAELLAEAGVDLIALEMLRDEEHAQAAVEGALATGLPVWAGFSCKRSEDGDILLLDVADPAAFRRMLERLPSPDVAAVTIMHTEVADTPPALEEAAKYWRGPLGAYPHHGVFRRPNWGYDDTLSPEQTVEQARRWVALGARIVGTCCGLGPGHIRALSEAFADRRAAV